MATNRTPETLRGVLVPDPRIGYAQWSSSLSTVTQAGPLPGIPEAQQATDMVLASGGTQAAGTRLRLRMLKGGNPGPEEGGLAYKSATDPVDGWRGWEPPQAISDWRPIDWTDVSGTWRYPHAVKLADETVLVAVQKSGHRTVVWSRSPTTFLWTEYVVYIHGTYTYGAHPTLVVLPSGRVLCYCWDENATLGQNQIRAFFSDNKGVTWGNYSRGALRTPVTVGGTVTPGRLRAAYGNNQVVLVASVTDTSLTFHNIFVQFASSDEGTAFTTVNTWTGSGNAESGAYHDIVVHGGQFLFGSLRQRFTPSPASADVVPHMRRITNAFEAFSTAAEIDMQVYGTNPMSWGTVAAGAFSAGDFAFWRDGDGVLYNLGRDHQAGSVLALHAGRSIDGGDTWEPLGISSALGDGAGVYNGNSASRYILDFCAVPVQGRTLLVHRFVASAGTRGPSLCAAMLGGYTSVTLPSLYGFTSAAQRVGWERFWLPFDLPDATAYWTLATVGAPSITISTTTGELVVITVGGETVTYTAAPTATSLAEGLLFIHEMEKSSGAGTVFFRARLGAAGPHDYDVRIEVTTTSIILRDMNFGGGAGQDIATVATTAGAADGVQIKLAISNPTTGAPGNDGWCKAWYRAASPDPDRLWVAIGTSITLVDGVTSTSSAVVWGAIGAAISRWRMWGGTSDLYTGEQLTGFANPTDLLPRNLAADPLYVHGGTSIAATQGPCRVDEEWDVDTRYQYGIEHAHPDVSPSPAYPHRTTGETQTDIVWEIDATLDQETPPLSPTLGLHLANINWRTGTFSGWDKDTGAWISLATIDAAAGMASLRWTRQGHRLVVDASVPGTNLCNEYFTYNALEGAHFSLSGSVVRKIARNSEGAWSTATTKRPVLDLDGVTSGDPTSGTTGSIWAKDVTILVNAAPSKFTRYRLRIDAQTTAEGYFQGKYFIGHLVVFARQYSLGRGQTWTANSDVETHPSGARTVTVRGGTRRSATVAWIEGTHTTQLGATIPVPDYVLPFTGAVHAIASTRDTPYLVAGLLESLGGAKSLLVYLPKIEVKATGVLTIVGRHLQLFGRITSPVVTLGSLLGDEWSAKRGEVLTVEAVTIEGEQ